MFWEKHLDYCVQLRVISRRWGKLNYNNMVMTEVLPNVRLSLQLEIIFDMVICVRELIVYAMMVD